MAIKLTNNARSTLAAALINSSTTLTIISGDAARFPSLGTDDWFPLTIVAPSGEYEIVRATARSGANITISRAQEGTNARAFEIGAKVDIRLTAAVVADLHLTATTTKDGRMSAADKTKLNGIPEVLLAGEDDVVDFGEL